MSENQQNTIVRFACVFGVIALGFVVVLVKIILIQTTEREKWLNIANKQVKTDQVVPATRGNILDCEGRILSSSMPQYNVYFDGGVTPLHAGGDTLFRQHVDELSRELSRIIGDKSEAEYKRILTNAHHKYKRSERLSRVRINYLQKKELDQLPLIKKGKYTSGITYKDVPRRVKPFGSLMSRTLGNTDIDTGYGRTGLEARFDKELRGTDGRSTRQKIGNRFENITVDEAEDGMDVVTTVDVDLQDIVESSLRRRLEHTQADWGCCILMETKSGKIRAISNLGLDKDGSYYEDENHAVKRVEPGSTFKTIALMAALDDGKVKIDDTISVTREPWLYMKARHTDAHPKDTFYTVRSALAISSNIALAKIITRSYEGSAKKFVRRIEKMGLMDSVYCEIPGAHKSKINVPKDTVTLSRMSYGYSVEMTPMQILMFYNAIANNGKMIRPYLVSEIRQGEEVVEKFGTETVCSSICKSSTLEDIRGALHDVVWDNDLPGTAAMNRWKQRKAQSDKVAIAGKTGTAQMLIGGRYTSKHHRMTFVGYFPEEDPQYTCICMIEHPHNFGLYDAGLDCGTVVRQIAEKTMALKARYEIRGTNKRLVLNHQ